MTLARVEFEKLLRVLHVLEQTGNSLGSEGDSIRDALEEPWRAMAENEREEMRKLSSSLFLEKKK